jgi:hypothetical protein
VVANVTPFNSPAGCDFISTGEPNPAAPAVVASGVLGSSSPSPSASASASASPPSANVSFLPTIGDGRFGFGFGFAVAAAVACVGEAIGQLNVLPVKR